MGAKPEKDYRKPCTICGTPRDVLVRCQIDETGQWHFVCPGKCWKSVSGGVIDGDKSEQHQHYRYGGMWKNKHEAVSAKKKPRKAAEPASSASHHDGAASNWSGDAVKYTKNDRVRYSNVTWICRKSHESQESKPPAKAQSLWKEDDSSLQDDTAEGADAQALYAS